MERIINMTEASAISESDYIVIDSPTLGTRKYLAANLAGGGGGDTPWNSIYVSSNQDSAVAYLSSEGWYTQLGSAAPVLTVSNSNNLTMYGKTKFEAHLHIKTLDEALPSNTVYIIGNGSSLCSNAIALNSDHTLTFSAKNINYTTTATLSADTEYIIDFIVDVTNSTISYSIKLIDDTIVESNSYSQSVSYDNNATNWQIFSSNGYSKMEGELYLPDSYIKVDDVLIWGTEPLV